MRFTHRFFRNDFMPRIANISTYKFAELHDLPTLRERLRGQSLASELKGTILLSPEGINLFIAGELPAVEAMVETIRAIPGLEDLAPKWSESEEQPFNRMLVKIKKEIIAFGVEGINPARYTSPRISARELKQWLDEGRPVHPPRHKERLRSEDGNLHRSEDPAPRPFQGVPGSREKVT
jgi:UPF0176 protein